MTKFHFLCRLKIGPEIVPEVAPENLSQFPVQRQHMFPMGGLEGIPATSTAQESSEAPPISELRERVSALRKSYAGPPIVMSQGVPAWEKFNFGQNQAQAQGSNACHFCNGDLQDSRHRVLRKLEHQIILCGL